MKVQVKKMFYLTFKMRENVSLKKQRRSSKIV